MSVRVAGCDPGTSSLDAVVLEGGEVRAQARFLPDQLRADPASPVRWLEAQGPLDLVAAPSGYGLPLVRAADCAARDRGLMSLVRGDDTGASGVGGFTAVVEAFCSSALPAVFLPGVIHLGTVPAHRKLNRVDMGTADKLSVAALALRKRPGGTFGLVELGTAFTALLVVERGRIVDGLGGTSGPPGWGSGGAWDGELAYLLSPLTKNDLFRGGVSDVADRGVARRAFREGVVKAAAGLRAATPFREVVLSGRLLEAEPELAALLAADLAALGEVSALPSLPGAWVKQAAQGAAVLADGLAGGRWADLVAGLELRGACGTVLDHVCHPRRMKSPPSPAGEGGGS